MGLELYEELEIDAKRFVRKERLEQLQEQFDAVCRARAEFVDKVYEGLRRRARDEAS
jgi:hypothetical protein